jgi:hypothetical protein
MRRPDVRNIRHLEFQMPEEHKSEGVQGLFLIIFYHGWILPARHSVISCVISSLLIQMYLSLATRSGLHH